MLKQVCVTHKSNLNVEDFLTNFLPKKPIKILGLADLWPAMDKWSEQFFRKRYGDLIVPVRKYKASSYEKIHMKLSAYLDYWIGSKTHSGQEHLYLTDWEITRQPTPLVEDFSIPVYFQDDQFDRLPKELKFGRTWIFIGHPFVSVPLHQDTFSTSAWLTMIKGTKVIRLVPPQYADSLNKTSSLFDEQYVATLLEKNIPLFETKIERGDTLYIPGRWFHEVKNIDNNIMLTKNFLDKWNFLNFTVEFEEKFNQPVKKVIEERRKFIKSNFTNQDMFNEMQSYIPVGLNDEDKRLLANKKI